jgi:hypothetical protein
MSHRPDHERLLADVLAEGAPANFPEALLSETLQQARQRRRFRRACQRSAALVMVGLLGMLAWRHWPRFRFVGEPVVASCATIRTKVLPASAIVRTQPFGPARLIISASNVAVIWTSKGQFRFVNDDELLALVARPAVLVRLGAHSEILVLANPANQNGFPVN